MGSVGEPDRRASGDLLRRRQSRPGDLSGDDLRPDHRRPAPGARRRDGQGDLGVTRRVPAGSIHADDGAAGGEGEGDHRRQRRRSADARVLRRLRRGHRPARVALLHRPRRSVEGVRERRDEESGRDVGQGVVEERRRRRGVGRLRASTPMPASSTSAPATPSRGRICTARRSGRTTCMRRRSSPSISTPASCGGTTRSCPATTGTSTASSI